MKQKKKIQIFVKLQGGVVVDLVQSVLFGIFVGFGAFGFGHFFKILKITINYHLEIQPLLHGRESQGDLQF